MNSHATFVAATRVLAGVMLAAFASRPASGQLLEQPPVQQSAEEIKANETRLVIDRCTMLDASDPPDVRFECWDAASRAAPTDSRVLDGRARAQKAMKEAEKTQLSQVQTKATKDSIEFLLARGNEELARESFDGADRYAQQVLEKDPSNQRAIDLKATNSTARQLHAKRRMLFQIGGAIATLIAFLVLFRQRVKALFPAKEDGGSSNSRAPAASSSRVALRIVDGVGRGRMYTIESDTYRIGAAASERVEEKNDLVLSDSGALVSRFHCALLRRKKRWTIVDSSVNGTWVNDKQLQRGEALPLRDGDEIVVAGISRMTFVVL